MRAIGLTEWVTTNLPPELVPVFVAITALGDPLFLVALAPVVYWLGPRYGVVSRENGARLLAVTLAALALTVLLKHWFALPRPPDSVALIAADGFGFPSGHATGSAAAYGGFAMLATWHRRRTRALLAGGLIGLVALSRVVLGVHYLADVVTGAALGLGLAVLVVRLTDESPRDGFRLAVLVGLGTMLVAWPAYDAAASIGGALGAFAAWEVWGERLRESTVAMSVPLASGGLLVFGGLAGATYVLEPSAPLVVLSNAVTGVGFVALPLASARLG